MFEFLISTVVVRPAYEQADIYRDFLIVLEKNQLQKPKQFEPSNNIDEQLSLFVFAIIHRVQVNLPDGITAYLQGGYTSEANNRQLRISVIWEDVSGIKFQFVVFQTTISVDDYCSDELVHIAQKENDIESNAANWSSPIEIASDWKLRLMV